MFFEDSLFNKISSIQGDSFQDVFGKRDSIQSESQLYLLQAVIESFVDGILILTTKAEVIHVNEEGRELCTQLNKLSQRKDLVPQEVWSICEHLIESKELFPNENIQIESQLDISQGIHIRLRARWVQLGVNQENLLLVTLEDLRQTTESQAMADAKKYGLTEREAEVWLLRRGNLSYKQIAAQLYITINTVKKHLKSVYAKQQELVFIQ